jgi:hypothetical protein
MRSEAEPAEERVQLFLWFLAPSVHDEAVRQALKRASVRLVAESHPSLLGAPVHYRRVAAVEPNQPSPQTVSTWMDVHPPVACSRAQAYLALVDRVARETGLHDWVQGERHAEWFSCA